MHRLTLDHPAASTPPGHPLRAHPYIGRHADRSGPRNSPEKMGANTSRAQQTRRRAVAVRTLQEQAQPAVIKADHPRKSNEWDADAVAALVKSGKLAPPTQGEDDPTKTATEECPICFLYFPTMNSSKCCNQTICTSCYLQVRPQNGSSECPFCSVEDFAAEACECKEECKIDTPVAHKVSIDETVATVSIDDRRKMEAELRDQQMEARRRGDVPEPVPGAAPQRRGWRRPQFILRRRGSNPGEGTQALPLDDVHRLLASLGDLQHVEDLMLLEAMQASMQDEAQRRARAASEGDEAPPPPMVSQEEDDDDDDDAAFRLAVRASLRESGGDVDDEDEDEEEESEDDTDEDAEAKDEEERFLDELPDAKE